MVKKPPVKKKGSLALTRVEGPLTHLQAAQRLHLTRAVMVEALRRGLVAYGDYVTVGPPGETQETWHIHPEELDRFQQMLIAQKHANLSPPQEFRIGIRQRVYNWSLRAARLRLGLKMSVLARLAGVSAEAISSYESFRSYPSAATAKKIAQALDTEVEIIFPAVIKQLRLSRRPSLIDDAHLSLEQLSATLSVALLSSGSDPEEEAIRKELQTTLAEVLNTLSPREQKVLRLHYGLEDGVAQTLEMIGQKLQLTRERIRQIENKALRRLRSGRRGKKLRDSYVE